MNCHCEVYPFPHRPLGGKCRGEEIQRRAIEESHYCAECPWCLRSEERHPYGEGVAIEYLRECTVDPEHCPAVQAAQERRAAS